MFPFFQSILFLLVVMLGGADRLLGPLIGACVVVLLPELLATLGQYRLLFVGALMLVVLRLAPVGLVGVVAHLFPRKGREAAPQQRTDVSRFLAAGATGSGISVRNLAVSFGGVHAVRDLSYNSPSQAARLSHTCRNWLPHPDRPDRREFCPSYLFCRQAVATAQKSPARALRYNSAKIA